MNQQQIADRLHAAFLRGMVTGKPWLAVAAEMEAINNPVVEPIYPDCHHCKAKGSMRHTLTESFCVNCGFNGDDDSPVEMAEQKRAPDNKYRMLKADDSIQEFDEFKSETGWRLSWEKGSLVGPNHVGYYRRPLVVEPSPVAKIQTERNMALDAGVEYQQLLEKHKAIEESNKSLVDRGIQQLRIIGEQELKLQQAATYTEGLERDLEQKESVWEKKYNRAIILVQAFLDNGEV